jgi:hypothetical protein
MMRGVIQPKLEIGQLDDLHEHEAERVADQMVRDSTTARSGGLPSVDPARTNRGEKPPLTTFQHERAGISGFAGGGVAAVVDEVLCAPGQPLDETTRAFFEPRFGFNFSNVRVHTDAQAVHSARAV